MKFLPAVLALSVFAAGAAAQDESYGSTRLSVGDRADDVLAEDLNGDGKPDLIVQSGLDLRCFLFGADGAFRPEADHTLRLEGNSFLWTLAKFCDGPLPTVVTASSRGIHRYVSAGGGFAPRAEDLAVHSSIFEGVLAPDRGPLCLDFMRDLTGDGLADAVLFARGEILVLPQERQDGHPEFALSQELPVPIDTGVTMLPGPHQKVREVTSVPTLAFGDVNDDRRTDISYYQNDLMGTYFQQADGRFSAQNPLQVGEKRKPRSTYLKFEVAPQIADLDGDGLLDVVVVDERKGRTHVYLNHGGRYDFTNPDSVLQGAEGWSTGVFIRDLDRDGRMEIVMGVIRKFGIIGGIDVFISKKIDVELHFFHFDPSRGTYPNEPLQQLKFSLPYTIQATREAATVDVSFRPCFDADIDGDGRLDLLVEKDSRTLDVFYGVKDKLIADEAGGSIRMDPPDGTVSTLPFVADFNGDGRSDLVLRYLLTDRKKNSVEVKLSRPASPR